MSKQTSMSKIKTLMVLLVIASLVLSISMMVAAAPAPGGGVESLTIDGFTYLHQIDKCPIDPTDAWVPFGAFETGTGIMNLGGSADVFWHFIFTSEFPALARVKFTNGAGTVLETDLASYKNAGNAVHYGITTPAGYKLTNAYLYGEFTGLFNLSHVSYEQIVTTTTGATTTVINQTTTTGETTTAVIETTIEQTTTSIGETTTTVPTTLITLITETPPLVSETTTAIGETTIVLTTTDIPRTGETPTDSSGLLIGIILLILAGGLSFVVYRSRLSKTDAK